MFRSIVSLGNVLLLPLLLSLPKGVASSTLDISPPLKFNREKIRSESVAFLNQHHHKGIPLKLSTLSKNPLLLAPSKKEEYSSNRDSPLWRHQQTTKRRYVLSILLPNILLPLKDAATATTETSSYTGSGKGYTYTCQLPPDFRQSNKPLKTHLDEVQFKCDLEGYGKYVLGVTVDPVRIDSLKQFGTPEEVAARVVTAEVNRDGVDKVTLAKDAKENEESGVYEVDYISDGKRGKKHFVTRIYIEKNMLYVLTVQILEDQYQEKENEIMKMAASFAPGSVSSSS